MKQVICLALACLMSGCLSPQEGVQAALHDLHTTGPRVTLTHPNPPAVRVGTIGNRSPASRGFLYRRSNNRFETDEQNRWVLAPEALIQRELASRLHASETFERVTLGTVAPAPLTIRGELLTFEASPVPEAVIVLQLHLWHDQTLLLSKRYQAAIGLRAATAESYARASAEAMESILGQFFSDLIPATMELPDGS